MATTLVAIFDDANDAREACRMLTKDGIDKSRLSVTPAEADTVAADSGRRDHRGFFARLFGLDQPDEDTGHYAEAVRRGSTVVTVDLADDKRVKTATLILENAGAIDVDRRIGKWQEDGYTGHDPNAAPYTATQAEREREKIAAQEQLQARKRTVPRGGVRVHRHLSGKSVMEDATWRPEAVGYAGPDRRHGLGASYAGPERRASP